MVRRPPRSTLFPYRRSSDLSCCLCPRSRRQQSNPRSGPTSSLPPPPRPPPAEPLGTQLVDRKSTRLNSSHSQTSYAVFCLKKKTSPSSACCSPPFTAS